MPKREKERAALWRKRKDRLQILLLFLLAAVSVLSATPFGRSFWRAAFQWARFSPKEGAPLRIHFIDVGKADAILLECKGHAALLDAGTYADGEAVSDYLDRCDVRTLDFAVVSHPDKDHLGGMGQVLLEKGAGALLCSRLFSEKYEEIDKTLAAAGIPKQFVSAGDTIELGGAALRFLGPLQEYEETNDASLVFRLDYLGFSALFCGDIEEEAEMDLVKSGAKLSANLLKVAHHGSDTSSKKRFLREVSPAYAAISVGKDKNDLPAEETLERLDGMGISVYRTDLDGTVVFSWNGKTVKVETESDWKNGIG